MTWNRLTSAAHGVFVLGVTLGLGLGCAGLPAPPVDYVYFADPASNDAWSPKIAGWQRRERADQGPALSPVSDSPLPPALPPSPPALDLPEGDLRSKYFRFRSERKRRLAFEVAEWIQGQAREHYVADGPIDHWATFEETLRGDGDDCDGLELLTFHALRDLGFDPKEVYRAIVYRPEDGQHHMVTLWFEDRDDPWVIDPTGAMTKGMPRMSELPHWVPLKLFSDEAEYTVRQASRTPAGSEFASTRMPTR